MYSSFRKDKKDDGEDGGSAVAAFANIEKTAVMQASLKILPNRVNGQLITRKSLAGTY